jgi:hypothetical protein
MPTTEKRKYKKFAPFSLGANTGQSKYDLRLKKDGVTFDIIKNTIVSWEGAVDPALEAVLLGQLKKLGFKLPEPNGMSKQKRRMKMKIYGVKVPIAGHAYVEVEAENEEEAIERAFEEAFTTDMIEEWDTLRQFNQGNVCYCPHPWQAEAELVDDGEGEEAA